MHSGESALTERNPVPKRRLPSEGRNLRTKELETMSFKGLWKEPRVCCQERISLVEWEKAQAGRVIPVTPTQFPLRFGGRGAGRILEDRRDGTRTNQEVFRMDLG